MQDYLNISAKLSLSPSQVCHPVEQEVIVVTRGATARIMFGLENKFYSLSSIDQFTYVLKQNNFLWRFDLYTYLRPTKDLTVQPNKIYFKDVRLVQEGFSQVTATRVDSPTGSPVLQKYYEEMSVNEADKDSLVMLNPQFSFDSSEVDGKLYESIGLALSPEDTIKFQPGMDNYVLCEAVIRIDTEISQDLNYSDTTLVEPQPPLLVRDSLYSHLG